MPLAPGSRLGPYEILATIGAGGMGEVYKARDTKLKRAVALKVLPDAFARDPDRMARFQREAEVLASLNHPNIAQIYGVEDRALVMELVEGETLPSPLPMETALGYARQIAEALEYAHERGVIHRDLKPANVKVTGDGVVKLLDFGLAKAIEDDPQAEARPTDSPTLTLGATRVGMIMGTAAYMSPEQAGGKRADRRADIWSFGAVLYEMLSGKRAFSGESVADTLAAVLKLDPDWNALPQDAPAPIQSLVRRCLTKDRKQRLQAIGEARIVLENPNPGRESGVTPGLTAGTGWAGWAAAAMLALALGWVTYRHVTEETRVLKMSVLPPPGAAFKSDSLPAVSPDGRRLAFVATLDGKQSLWVRDLDSLAARALTGTDDARYPFWSPDGHTIAFFAGGKLKKIDEAGGPALTLYDVPVNPRGGTWSKNDVIVFGVNGGNTFRVPAAGGSAAPLTALDQASRETGHRFPWFLPDGRHFLYTATNQDLEKTAIYAADLDSKNRTLIVTAQSNAVYAPPGYLLFARERTLMAQPFDAGKLQITGAAVPIAEQVDFGGTLSQNQFSVSQNGVLAYTSGGSGRNVQLTWFDRSGKTTGTVGAPGLTNWGAISPDGNTVAVDRVDPQTQVLDIWLHDLARGTASRFTFGPRTNDNPVWSPDGGRVAFSSVREGRARVFEKATAGAAQEELLDKGSAVNAQVDDWSRDGRYLIESLADGGATRGDIWVLPLFGDRKAFPYLQTEFKRAIRQALAQRPVACIHVR